LQNWCAVLCVGAVGLPTAETQSASCAKFRQVCWQKKFRQVYVAAVAQLVHKQARGVIGVALARAAVETVTFMRRHLLQAVYVPTSSRA